RFTPARTAVCTAADIECDLPAPRPPRNSQHHDRSGGGSWASRAAKTQSSAASSPSPRISSSASSGVISLISRRNWCMRLPSCKKRSAIGVVLSHDFAFDVAIFLSSFIIDERADFLGRQQHVAGSDGAVQGRLITGKRRADNRENLLNFDTPTKTKRHHGYARPQRWSAVPVRPETALRRRRQGRAAASTGTGFQNRLGGVEHFRPSILLRSSLLTPRPILA